METKTISAFRIIEFVRILPLIPAVDNSGDKKIKIKKIILKFNICGTSYSSQTWFSR
jgi:hypothetical protein